MLRLASLDCVSCLNMVYGLWFVVCGLRFMFFFVC
jgi:hypothetical protein